MVLLAESVWTWVSSHISQDCRRPMFRQESFLELLKLRPVALFHPYSVAYDPNVLEHCSFPLLLCGF